MIQKTFKIILILSIISSSNCIFQGLLDGLSNMRQSLFPTQEEVLGVHKIQNDYQKNLIENMINKQQDGTYLLYSLIYYNLYLNLKKFCVLNFSIQNCEQFEENSLNLLKNEMQLDIMHREEGHGVTPDHEQAQFKRLQDKDFYDMNTIFEQMFQIKEDYHKNYKSFLAEFQQLINMEENMEVITDIIQTYHKNLEELQDYFQYERELEKKKIFEDNRI